MHRAANGGRDRESEYSDHARMGSWQATRRGFGWRPEVGTGQGVIASGGDEKGRDVDWVGGNSECRMSMSGWVLVVDVSCSTGTGTGTLEGPRRNDGGAVHPGSGLVDWIDPFLLLRQGLHLKMLGKSWKCM